MDLHRPNSSFYRNIPWTKVGFISQFTINGFFIFKDLGKTQAVCTEPNQSIATKSNSS